MRISIEKYKFKEIESIEGLKEDIEEEGVELRQQTR
jgi:hypothetical protein